MKLLAVTLIAIVGIANATLQDDLKDFEGLIPKDQITSIAAKHMLFDKQFKKTVDWLKSSNSAPVAAEFAADPDVLNIEAYLNAAGYTFVPVTKTVSKTMAVQPKLANMTALDLVMNRDFSSFLDEVVAVLPQAEISAMMKDKIANEPDFAAFYSTITSAEFNQLVMTARNSPNLTDAFNTLSENGIDSDHILQICQEILSWGQ